MDKKLYKRVLIIFLISLVVILIITKSYLYVNYLFGNDVLIKVSSSSQYLNLSHGESSDIEIVSSIVANPFCQAICNYEFLGPNNTWMEEGTFKIKTGDSYKQNYTLSAPESGEGHNLYRFNLECSGTKGFLCETSIEPYVNSILIGMSYSSSDTEVQDEEKTKALYTEYFKKINQNHKLIRDYSLAFKNRNITLDENLSLSIKESTDKLWSINKTFNLVILDLSNERYSDALDKISLIESKYLSIELEIFDLGISLSNYSKDYNSLIDKMNKSENLLEFYKDQNLTEKDFETLSNLISMFNENKMLFLNESTIDEKILLVNRYEEILNQGLASLEGSGEVYSEGKLIEISKEKLTKIDIIKKEDYKIIFPIKNSICCITDKCNQCCDESCFSNSSLFPVLLIHGHSLSSRVPSYYILESLSEMQEELEKDGFVNGGSLFTGIHGVNNLQSVPYPLSIKESYYYDFILESEKTNLLDKKEDSIDVYALRLNEIIEKTKQETNREKIDLVAHSMGGLVARRYIQIFGTDSLNQVILVTVPNNGISQDLYDNCISFGSEKECEDMYNNSTFIKRLETQRIDDIPIYNIIGQGCSTYGEDGDGTITTSEAYLDWAENYYINGSCSTPSLRFLHNYIILPEESPEAYGIISDILKDNQ